MFDPNAHSILNTNARYTTFMASQKLTDIKVRSINRQFEMKTVYPEFHRRI